MKIKLFFLFLFIFCLHNIHALDISLTKKQLEIYTKIEDNRNFNFYSDVSTIGVISLNDMFTFKTGLSIGGAKGITDLKAYSSAAVSPFEKIPLDFSLFYIYNGLPQYHAHSHTILPLASINAKYAGLSLGPNFRFSSFFGDSAQFESILTFSAYVNFINNKLLRIGLSLGNFNDFCAANLGAISLKLLSSININENWSLVNDYELLHTGLDGFSSTYYGFTWRGGARYKW